MVVNFENKGGFLKKRARKCGFARKCRFVRKGGFANEDGLRE